MSKMDGAYIFQGNSLVIPVETQDSELTEELSFELIDAAFGSLNDIDRFTVPSVDRGEKIRTVTIPEGALPAGWKAINLRQVLNTVAVGKMAEGKSQLGRLMRSCHLGTWRRESRFCGSCGSANRDADEEGPARQCPACGRLEFPRISPAVIIIVTNDKDEIVLAHNKKFASGVYSIIAGFTEVGESLEDTVAREIKEEVNIEVKDIRYIGSQPWPFPNSLMLGFSARYSEGELKPDGEEIEDAAWFAKDNLPELPAEGSLSRFLINNWLENF